MAIKLINGWTDSIEYSVPDIMLQPSTSSEILAHWKYSQTEWQDFVSYVLNDRAQDYKSLSCWIVYIVLVALLIIGFLVLTPYLMLKPSESIWRSDVLGPVFGVAVVTFLIIAAIVFFRFLSKEKDRQLGLSSGGEVLITLTAVIVNGSAFDWEFGEKSRWRFQNVERKTVVTDKGKKIEILQFRCLANMHVHRVKAVTDKIERIPIPTGKETEVIKIIERLCAEKKLYAKS